METNQITGTISNTRKVYRLPLVSLYKNLDYLLDLWDTLDVLVQYHGKSISQEQSHIPPRDNLLSSAQGDEDF